jgi:hypothetical protein
MAGLRSGAHRMPVAVDAFSMAPLVRQVCPTPQLLQLFFIHTPERVHSFCPRALNPSF